jgi:hypothetical protein
LMHWWSYCYCCWHPNIAGWHSFCH